MKKNKVEKQRTMGQKKKIMKIVLPVVSVLLVLAIGCSIWYYYGHKNTDPVSVYAFNNIGMTEYWGDSKESYGPVTTDKIQTVFLTSTQTVTDVFVQEGDTVSKGDPLMAFDTTLSDLALERKRLDVEKLKLQLEDANAELKRIKNMKPMVVNPAPSKPATPSNPDVGRPINGSCEIISKDSSDGSSLDKAIVCWLSDSAQIDNSLLSMLHSKAVELQTNNQQANKPAATAETGEEPQDTTGAAETTDPTTEPTESEPSVTEPTVTEPPVTEPEPTEPTPVPVDKFYVVFKVTAGNTSLGDRVTWQGMEVSSNSYGFKLVDASSVKDPITTPVSVPEDDGPTVDYGSGYTAAEIAKMRSEQEKTIKDLQFSVKMAETEYKIMKTEVSDGKIYADIDGTVVSLLSPEEAMETQQPVMKVSGGGGFYVEGTVSELDKDDMRIGQEVEIMDWNSGMSYIGTVEKIGNYPSTSDGFYGNGNPNASYYPFTVFVDGSADLQPGYYVNIQYAAGESSAGIYLENPFIRTENGKSYVYVRNEEGLLEKRYVTTGKALWGSYTEILDGLSETDYIAFPYGKNVKEGAAAVEGDLSDLYNY